MRQYHNLQRNSMKNLLTYVHPSKEFTKNYVDLVKVQIDNSLRMGWNVKDIILATNFPYSYRGVNAIVVPDDLFCAHRKRASKINVICHLIEDGTIDDVCWFHDFDAYQVAPFPSVEKILEGKDAGFTDYGTVEMWNTGSFFFQPKALDMFKLIREMMYARRVNEEVALDVLTRNNVQNINSRYKKLNITYNLGRMRQVDETYAKADKPIRVFHFLPSMRELYEGVKPLLPPELVEILTKHGY